MRNKLMLLLSLAVILPLRLPASVYAAETVPIPVTAEFTQQHSPFNIERKNINGTEYLIKYFNVPPEIEESSLIDPPFEEDNYLFQHHTTEVKANETILTKEVTETKTEPSPSQELAQVLKQFPSTFAYEENGYTGELALDTGSITTEADGYTTNTRTVSTTKEYGGLMFNDPSYVPQTTVHNGYTLSLTGINWVVMATGLSGDSLVPTEYKAVATYSKKVSSQVATGYTSTAVYNGTVGKTETKSVDYIVTYTGTPMFFEETVEISDNNIEETAAKEPVKIPTGLIVGIFSCLAVGGAAVGIAYFIKSKRGVSVYNLMDGEYIYLGIIHVDYSKPEVNLNAFEEIIQSRDFNFIVDKYSTKRLFGKHIAVTLEDVTVMHMVKGHNTEYKFNLELGGMIDEGK